MYPLKAARATYIRPHQKGDSEMASKRVKHAVFDLHGSRVGVVAVDPSPGSAATGQNTTSIVKPPEGWQRGLELVLEGRCPYCRHRMRGVHVSLAHGLTWECDEGCKP